VGYCYTRGFALRVTAACPERIAPLRRSTAAASLHFGHAVNDRSMPEEAIRKLDAALETGTRIHEAHGTICGGLVLTRAAPRGGPRA